MVIDLWYSIVWFYGMQIFFTPLSNHFAWSRTVMSGAFSLQRIQGSILQPIEGFLVDRYGPRNLIILGILLGGMGFIILSKLNNIVMFYIGVLIVSGGTSLSLGIPRNWAIVQWFQRLRGRALGIGASGAVISGPLLFIVVWLESRIGWSDAFLVIGIGTWALCLPLAMFYRKRPEDYGDVPDGHLYHEGPKESKKPTTMEQPGVPVSQSMSASRALHTLPFWILTSIFVCQNMGVSGLLVHQIPYFESIGFTTSQAAWVLTYFTLLSGIGRLGGGWALDMFNQKMVLGAALVCQTLSFFIMVNITGFNWWQVFSFALLYGIGSGAMIPIRSVIMSNYYGPLHFGSIQGLSQSATIISGVTAPLLMGFIYDTTASYELSLYALIIITILALPLVALVSPPQIQKT